MDLSVIIPVYNEEGNITALFERLQSVAKKMLEENGDNFSYEFVFVNDGSKDDSINMIKKLADQHPFVGYVDFSRNFGHQVAVSAGLDHCSGDAIAIIDADLQDPPELIIDMYKKLRSGYEVVYAQRLKRAGESFFKKQTAKWFYRIIKSITSIDIPVDVGDFRVIDRKIVDVLQDMPEKNKFLRGQISWAGFNQTYVEYERSERFQGETGYPFKKMLSFALDGITSFSDFPLKIASFLGFISAFIAFLFILYALYSRFILQVYVEGWTSIMISVMFIGSVQLICLGIIGEYLIRIMRNNQNRPLYIVRKTNLEKSGKK